MYYQMLLPVASLEKTRVVSIMQTWLQLQLEGISGRVCTGKHCWQAWGCLGTSNQVASHLWSF